MRSALRVMTLAALVAGMSSIASGYYHWVFFANKSGPYQPIRMRFDLNALPGGAVPYFISSDGPSPMVEGDSFTSLVSQIRAAAETWNGVQSSALRLQFGGIAEIGGEQTAPGIDVVFDDEMAPGILALSKPTSYTDLKYLGEPDSPGFAPILRSRLQLRKDLTVYGQASYSDRFFLTIVHEFGHTLGLQHSLTSAVMSTEVTRGTSKPRPLSADDIAGLSLLYPTPEFIATTGAIGGRIMVENHGGANLMSVVALSTAGTTIGSMTNPDGTYLIEGLPPGDYYVYAHPLPPAQQGEELPAGIVPPTNLAGEAYPAYTGAETLFYPGTRDWGRATLVHVNAAQTAENISMSLGSRVGPAIYNLETWAYLGAANQEVPVHAPPLVSGDRRYLVFRGPGTLIDGTAQLAPGLTFSVIGGPARVEPETVTYWKGAFGLVVVDALETSAPAPVALAVNTNTDLYVLPGAFSVLASAHPRITAVESATDAQGNAVATVQGVNLTAATGVLFDGLPGKVLKANPDGSLTAAAPPASGTHRAAVEATTAGGQTSWQVLGDAEPPTFSYVAPDNPSIAVSPGTLVAGTDTMLEINGIHTKFLDGETVVGFGSSDIGVRQLWVLSPTRLLLNVSLGISARRGPVMLTVASGLQLVSNTVLQVQAGGVVTLRAPILNTATGLAGVPAGGSVIVQTSGLPEDLAGWELTMAGLRTSFVRGAYGQLTADVPAELAPGLVEVRIAPPTGASVAPVLLQIDDPPPAITAARGPGGEGVDEGHAVSAGDHVTLMVAGFAEPLAVVPAESVQVRAGGTLQSVESVKTDTPGVWEVVFVLATPGTGPQQTVTVGLGTRVSAPWALAIRQPD